MHACIWKQVAQMELLHLVTAPHCLKEYFFISPCINIIYQLSVKVVALYNDNCALCFIASQKLKASGQKGYFNVFRNF